MIYKRTFLFFINNIETTYGLEHKLIEMHLQIKMQIFSVLEVKI